MMNYTSHGPRKPDRYGPSNKVSLEDLIVLPDEQLNEVIDLNILYSEREDSAEIQAFRARSSKSETVANNKKSETVGKNTKFWKSETVAHNKKSETAAAYYI